MKSQASLSLLLWNAEGLQIPIIGSVVKVQVNWVHTWPQLIPTITPVAKKPIQMNDGVTEAASVCLLKIRQTLSSRGHMFSQVPLEGPLICATLLSTLYHTTSIQRGSHDWLPKGMWQRPQHEAWWMGFFTRALDLTYVAYYNTWNACS